MPDLTVRLVVETTFDAAARNDVRAAASEVDDRSRTPTDARTFRTEPQEEFPRAIDLAGNSVRKLDQLLARVQDSPPTAGSPTYS